MEGHSSPAPAQPHTDAATPIGAPSRDSRPPSDDGTGTSSNINHTGNGGRTDTHGTGGEAGASGYTRTGSSGLSRGALSGAYGVLLPPPQPQPLGLSPPPPPGPLLGSPVKLPSQPSTDCTSQQPLSLQEYCSKLICRNLSVYNCLELLEVTAGVEVPACRAIHDACMRYAANSFETLQAVRSEDQLRSALPPEMYDGLAAAAAERTAVLAEARGRLGQVREATVVEVAAREGPSAAGHPFSYPLEALVAGVAWPPGVAGGAREEYLSPDDFAAHFGMPYEAFRRLPGWRQTRAKKELQLF